MEPTFNPDPKRPAGEKSTYNFDKRHILIQSGVPEALADLERLHVATGGNEPRDVVNLPELFRHFLDDPDLYRELLSAKLIVALNESIPAVAEQDRAVRKTYLEAWGTLVAKVLYVLSSDNISHQLEDRGRAQMPGDTVHINFGTAGKRIFLNQTPTKQWQLGYYLTPQDEHMGSKDYPMAMSRLFPDRFLVQTAKDKQPRKLAPDEHPPLVGTSFIVDLRPGERDIAEDGTSGDIDLPPQL